MPFRGILFIQHTGMISKTYASTGQQQVETRVNSESEIRMTKFKVQFGHAPVYPASRGLFSVVLAELTAQGKETLFLPGAEVSFPRARQFSQYSGKQASASRVAPVRFSYSV